MTYFIINYSSLVSSSPYREAFVNSSSRLQIPPVNHTITPLSTTLNRSAAFLSSHASPAGLLLLHQLAMLLTGSVTELEEFQDGIGAYTPCPRKKEASSFSTISLAFLDRFSQFYINGNRNKYSMTTCNLLTYQLYGVITVTRRMSRQFNLSLHVKINHIEFKDKFLIKPTRM